MTLDPYILYKCQWLDSTASKREGAKYHRKFRQILEVTEELGREAPHRRVEVERSIIEIERKLVGAVAELVYLTDEIARGCNPCQIN